MSLVITSSKQQQYDGLVGKNVGVEKPFSYKNHMKSPLIIKKGSEIAVVSVRVDKAQQIQVRNGDRMGLYWGQETVADDIVTVEPNLVCFLEIPNDTYTIEQFADALQTELINLGQTTFSNFRTATVVTTPDNDNSFVHFKIKFSQNASATDIAGNLASGSFVACVNANNKTPVNAIVRETYGAAELTLTDDFNVSGNEITAGSDATKGCVFIAAKDYLSSTSGVCEFNFSDAPGDIRVGLVRNMPVDRPAPSNFNNIREQSPNFSNDEGNRIDEFYDYCFQIKRTGTGVPTEFSVGQAVIVNNPGDGLQMVKVPSASYTTATPNASFDTTKGTYFDKVRFTRFGEQIKIELIDNKSAATTLIDAGSGALKPCGQFSDLLYAKGEMLVSTEKLVIDRFDKGTATSKAYNDSRTYGFGIIPSNLPPDHATLVAREAAELQDLQTNFCSGMGSTATSIGYNDANLDQAPLYDTINASGGQQRSWVVVLGPDEQYNTQDVNGQMIPNDDMRRALGFSKTPLLESGDEDPTLSLTNDVVFKSDQEPDFSATESMFIRWNATQQQSYNCNQGSISKIIYACPRFDIRGSESGGLYYEPYERVYVDCNNPDDLMITDVGVDIVDVNERLVTSLTGDTQINFHVRQKEKFQPGPDSGRT